MSNDNLHDLNAWVYPQDLVRKYPVLTLSAVMYHLRERDHNGLGKSVTRIGRKLAVHEPSYLAWLTNPDRKSA